MGDTWGKKTKAVDKSLTNHSAPFRKTVRDVTEASAKYQQKSGQHPKYTCGMTGIDDYICAKSVNQSWTNMNSSVTCLNAFLNASYIEN